MTSTKRRIDRSKEPIPVPGNQPVTPFGQGSRRSPAQHPPDDPASRKSGDKRKKGVQPLHHRPCRTHEIRHRRRARPVPFTQRRCRFPALIWNHPEPCPGLVDSGPVEFRFHRDTEPAIGIVNQQAVDPGVALTIRPRLSHSATRLPPAKSPHQDDVVAAA